MSPRGSRNEAQSGLGSPWRNEISPKKSSGGAPEVTNDLWGVPEGLQERF